MFSKNDVSVLRKYAAKLKYYAEDPRNGTLREMWKDHTALKGKIPPVFVSPEGSWAEILPEGMLECLEPGARSAEREIRQRIVRAEHIRDDVPIEADIVVQRASIPIQAGWGLVPEREPSPGPRGAWKYKPVVERPSDWKALRQPRLDTDDTRAREYHAAVGEAIGDILNVRLTGIKNFSFHMMHLYCDFRGLNNMLADLCDEPEMVREVIGFFTDGYLKLMDEAEAAGLVASNNDASFHYTGGLGYNRELPEPGDKPAALSGVWGAAEAQEFALVSPDMHEEFILKYERKLLERFGLNGYGCCDDLTDKLENVLKIKNLRRVGICPWSDLRKCAERLQKDYIMTWKPQPSYLAHETYDEAFVENYLTESLIKGKNGYMEIVLRDTHTCRGDINRFGKFVRSARRAIEKSMEYGY